MFDRAKSPLKAVLLAATVLAGPPRRPRPRRRATRSSGSASSAPTRGANARYGAFAQRGAPARRQGDQRGRRRRGQDARARARRQPVRAGRRRVGDAPPDLAGQGADDHRRHLQLGDAGDAAGRRERRRAARQRRLVEPRHHLQGRRRRLQVDLPQLPDRRGPRRRRAAIRGEAEELHEVRGAVGRQRLRPRRHQLHQEVPAALWRRDPQRGLLQGRRDRFPPGARKIRRSGAQAILMYGLRPTPRRSSPARCWRRAWPARSRWSATREFNTANDDQGGAVGVQRRGRGRRLAARLDQRAQQDVRRRSTRRPTAARSRTTTPTRTGRRRTWSPPRSRPRTA